MQRNLIPEMAASAIAGVVATCPMTRFMETFDHSEIEKPDSDLPPRTITAEAMRGASGQTPPEAVLQPATKLAHYSYGGMVGGLYPLVASRSSPSTLLNGAAFGLGVWTASYLGLLPALGSSARATNRSARVNGIMIAAHLIWGVTVAVLADMQLQQLNSPAGEAEK